MTPPAPLRPLLAGRGPVLAILLAAGLFIAAPFFTDTALGTSEAYNYSLAVADSVTQMRSGVFPVLVGQSEYAWNGRIHPLRTAPYFTYAAGLLDLLTFRMLGFWTLQNLVVGLSLFGGVLSCYGSLRRAVPGLDARIAAGLAAAYGFSPGLLSTAYAMDLYMTVMTAPWIPLVLGGLVRAQREGTFGSLAQIAIGLAAIWLAHPPVAFWLTVVTLPAGLVVVITGWRRGRILLPVAGAGLLFAVLAGYAFVSALTVSGYHSITHVKDVQLLLSETRRVAAAALEPVSARADQLGDFQLGYAYWALLVVATGLALWRRQVLALVFVVVAAFFLALTLPVPGVQTWLWEKLPTITVTLTNQWPMQRLYLLVTLLAVFAFALGWRPLAKPWTGFRRDAAVCLLAAGVLWTGWEALPFVARGFATRLDAASSRRVHQPENIDLTVISFAMLGSPPWFMNGVIDPVMEFRLRAPFDAHVVAANADAPFAETAARGTFRVVETAADHLVLAPRLTLRPGRRYRLTFDFKTPPRSLILQLRGRTFFRQYSLPAAGGPEGFGLRPHNRHSLSLWTTSQEPEEIELWLVAPGIEAQSWMRFADFKLEATTLDQLPVAVETFVPLRVQVHAATAGYLEVPRMFLPGYAATVDRQPCPVQTSPDGLVLLPVPADTSQVELRYAGSPLLRAAFWLAFAGWAGMAAGLIMPRRMRAGVVSAIGALRRRMARINWRLLATAGAVSVALAAAWWGVHAWRRWREGAGPVVLQVIFPRNAPQGTQPLLVTGRPHAGTFVYVHYEDSRHVRLGVDVWGLLGKISEPIEADYFAVHTIEISEGALFPSDHPAVKSLPGPEREALRKRLRVVLDGRVVLNENVRPYDTRLADITVGENRIGGSNAGTRFTGRILAVRREPLHP
ncbi:MAG: hypothetical protein PHE83_01990 [Opitutaceae bacterium]|nr:hypothetical protein [Opitutaceae bacterium]